MWGIFLGYVLFWCNCEQFALFLLAGIMPVSTAIMLVSAVLILICMSVFLLCQVLIGTRLFVLLCRNSTPSRRKKLVRPRTMILLLGRVCLIVHSPSFLWHIGFYNYLCKNSKIVQVQITRLTPRDYVPALWQCQCTVQQAAGGQTTLRRNREYPKDGKENKQQTTKSPSYQQTKSE